MAPLDNLNPYPHRLGRETGGWRDAGWIIAAALFVILLLAAAFAPVAEDGGAGLEPPAAQRSIEDWHGNSARSTPAPLLQ